MSPKAPIPISDRHQAGLSLSRCINRRRVLPVRKMPPIVLASAIRWQKLAITPAAIVHCHRFSAPNPRKDETRRKNAPTPAPTSPPKIGAVYGAWVDHALVANGAPSFL